MSHHPDSSSVKGLSLQLASSLGFDSATENISPTACFSYVGHVRRWISLVNPNVWQFWQNILILEVLRRLANFSSLPSSVDLCLCPVVIPFLCVPRCWSLINTHDDKLCLSLFRNKWDTVILRSGAGNKVMMFMTGFLTSLPASDEEPALHWWWMEHRQPLIQDSVKSHWGSELAESNSEKECVSWYNLEA